MTEHVNGEDLLRFRDRSMSIAEIEATGRHLAECARCAAFAREMFRVDAPPRLSRAFANRDDEALARSARLRRFLLVAAAVLIVLAAGAAYLLLRAPHRAGAPPTTSIVPPPQHRYERDEWTALVSAALGSGKVTVHAPAGDAAAEQLRGSGGVTTAGAMTPSATAVESDRPELTWQAIPGARFVVTVADGDEVVARSDTIRTNHWTPARALARGRTYAWQVRVLGHDGIDVLPLPPRAAPRFRVLAEDEARDLAAARAAHPDDHLLLGVLAAHYGVRDDARFELGAYAATHPSPAAHRLAESAGAK